MNSTGCSTALLIAICFVALPSSAQIGDGPGTRSLEQQVKIVTNTRALQTTLRLDRTEYFPDEDAELTIAITNKSSSPVEVFRPFDENTGGIDLWYRSPAAPGNDRRLWGQLASQPSVGLPNGDAPSIWMQPGLPVEKKYRFSHRKEHDTGPDGRPVASVCHQCRVPDEEGEYRFCYTYGTLTCAEFKVVEPVLEQWSQVQSEQSPAS